MRQPTRVGTVKARRGGTTLHSLTNRCDTSMTVRCATTTRSCPRCIFAAVRLRGTHEFDICFLCADCLECVYKLKTTDTDAMASGPAVTADEAAQTVIDIPLLIVGAGPAGASLACFLSRPPYSLTGLLISNASCTSQTPRAHITNPGYSHNRSGRSS